MADKCSVEVPSNDGWRFYSCSKPIKVWHSGKPYCTIHDPIYVKKKQKKQSEKWESDRKWERDRGLRDPRVVELVAAAKVLEMAHYRLAIDCNDCVCDEKLWDIGDGKRLRTALAAFKGEKNESA